jgi:drug/metabolite transporter (DMT)-like permease
MTDPPEPGNPDPRTPDPATPPDALDAYIRENHLRYSEAALREAALAAGNSPEAVEAALARYRAVPDRVRAERRAARQLLIAYVAVFGVLTAGMLIHMLTSADDAYAGFEVVGIGVLAFTLFLGYALSSVWLSNRRTAVFVLGLIIGLVGLVSTSSGGFLAVVLLVVGVAMVGAAVAFGHRLAEGFGALPIVLYSVPLLMLLAIGGTCVATGLPVPGG